MGAGAAVSRIDHVVVEAGDEHALFDFLTDRLGLPVAWPMAHWGLIHEGGVGFGSCNVGCNHPVDPASDPSATIRAIAFEPAESLAGAMATLEQRGVALTPPMPSGTIDVPDEPPFLPWKRGWSNALVLSEGLQPTPFLCAYDHDVDVQREASQAHFEGADGGPLGITEIHRVIIHTDDVAGTCDLWRVLLGEPIEQCLFDFRDRPGVRIHRGTGPPALVLGVRSTTVASAGLDELGIEHHIDSSTLEISLNPADLLGLDIRLVER
jgi:hypothetical protein